MASYKKLINRTGEELQVVLVIRKGDHPTDTAGLVRVELAAQMDKDGGEDCGAQIVEYGDDVDIFLNGIEATLLVDGKKVGQRRVVLDRGSNLDNALNMFNTIEFLYDGNTVLFSTSNTALDEADAAMPLL